MRIGAPRRLPAGRAPSVSTVASADAKRTRRAVLGSVAGTAVVLLSAGQALAKKFENPAQASSFGGAKYNGNSGFGGASQSSFNMEGTVKTGNTAKQRASVLQDAKALALKESLKK